MEYKDITLDQIHYAIKVIESNSETMDFQKLEEILPLVLVVLKQQAHDKEMATSGNKFYAPVWVNELLVKLSTAPHVLAPEEYDFYKKEVEKLSFDSYKSAEPSMFGYEVIYTSPSGISEIILSLKRFFHFL